jgi:hypothetical protein
LFCRDAVGRFYCVRPCSLACTVTQTKTENLIECELLKSLECESASEALLERWAKSIPLWKILVNVIPRKFGEDPLRCASNLTPSEVKIVSHELGNASAAMLEQYINVLRTSFANMDAAGSENSTAEKFMTFTADCGKASDFHGGLVERIGARNYARINLID